MSYVNIKPAFEPPSTIENVIGKEFIRKKSYLSEKERETRCIFENCTTEEFEGCKYVLLFFSAGWCAPCEQFLQVLKDFYGEVNIEEKKIEVLYISSDKNKTEWEESYAKMPWLSYRYEDPRH